MEECRGKKLNFFEFPMQMKQPFLAVSDTTRDHSLDLWRLRVDQENQQEMIEFPSHILQYTDTKPVVKYCENPKHATLHFITRVQLLETVPDDIALLMKKFWSSTRPKK